MRDTDTMQNSAPAKAAAIYGKTVSTLAETRIVNVYANETDSNMEITQYRVDWVIHRPNAKLGWENQASSLTFQTAGGARAWMRDFFEPVELTDADPRPSVE